MTQLGTGFPGNELPTDNTEGGERQASRTLCWISQGAASVMAAKLELSVNRDAILIRCETSNEDEDNARFEADVVRWLSASVTVIKSSDFDSVVDVWEKRRFMAGHHGAPCTTEMKIVPRLEFQKPDDVHVFGYTADAPDVKRFKRLRDNFPELTVRAPLIERGITKSSAMAMLWRAGITPPRTYAMGFPNANCLQTGCVKATSPDYWSLFRLRFPERFHMMAERSRRIGARLARINDERIFIDEIPADWPVLNPEVPVCDFLCALAEQDISEAACPAAPPIPWKTKDPSRKISTPSKRSRQSPALNAGTGRT